MSSTNEQSIISEGGTIISENGKSRQAPYKPKKPCEHCNKMISIPNMTSHLKVCKVKNQKIQNKEPMELKETISKQNDVIKYLKEEIVKMNERYLESEQKYERLLKEVIVIKKE